MTKLLFDSERAFKDIKKLAVDIGTRPSGGAKEKDAAKWIASEFEKMGLETSIEEFEVKTGKVNSKKLEVIEPYTEEIGCEVMPLYGSTIPEGVKGNLIYIDTLDEEHLNPEVAGKIILTSSGPKNRKKTFSVLSRHKPLGIIFIESTPRVLAKNLWGSSRVKEIYGEFPVVRITYEDGLSLLEKEAKKVHLVAESEETTVISQNVIGELKGDEKPDEIIIVGGHYDTVLEVSGAEDNAGGTALVLELARVFIDRGTKRTIRFIAWGSEELGLIGSRDYAKKLREASEKEKKDDEDKETDLERHLLCINLDVHGAFLGSNACRVLGPPELTASVKLLSKETGVFFDVKEDVYSSDGTPLSAVGVPSVSFSRRAPTNLLMHSTEDSMRWLNSKAIQVQGEFIELFMKRYVADSSGFPFEWKVPDEHKKKIEEYFKRALRKLP